MKKILIITLPIIFVLLLGYLFFRQLDLEPKEVQQEPVQETTDDFFYRSTSTEQHKITQSSHVYSNNTENPIEIIVDHDYPLLINVENLTQQEFEAITNEVGTHAFRKVNQDNNLQEGYTKYFIPANTTVQINHGYHTVKTSGVLYTLDEQGHESIIKEVQNIEWVYQGFHNSSIVEGEE